MQCFYLIIIAHHVPILGVLKPGVVSVFEQDGNAKRYFGKKMFREKLDKNSICIRRVRYSDVSLIFSFCRVSDVYN
jgi:hypothetical protein